MKTKLMTILFLSVILTGCGFQIKENSKQAPNETLYAESETETATTNTNIEDIYVEDLELTLYFDFGERTGIYTGHLVNGIPDGMGKFTSSSEEGIEWTHIGEWSEGHLNGLGTTFRKDGRITASTYENDRENGYGVIVINNTSAYIGEIENSEPSGTGTYITPDDRYVGEFANGVPDGKGTRYFSHVSALDGSFENGHVNGECTLTVDNTKIVGTFLDSGSGLNGTGIFYSDDGTSMKCEYKDGELIFLELEADGIQADNYTVNDDIQSKQSAPDTNINDEKETVIPEPNPEDELLQHDTSTTYVLNKKTHKFHSPSCRDVKKIADANYATSNSSRDSLLSQGYSPCGHCNP